MTYAEYQVTKKTLCAAFNCSTTSGIRSKSRNRMVGGATGSRHQIEYGGKADDLVPDDNTLETRSAIVRAARELGLVAIDETDHVHIHDNP